MKFAIALMHGQWERRSIVQIQAPASADVFSSRVQAFLRGYATEHQIRPVSIAQCLVHLHFHFGSENVSNHCIDLQMGFNSLFGPGHCASFDQNGEFLGLI